MTSLHRILGAALALLLILGVVASDSWASPKPLQDVPPVAQPGSALTREELQTLTAITRRIEGMMELAPFTRTEVWPQSMRDQHGHTMIFIASATPLLSMSTSLLEEDRMRWVVLAIVAAAKYENGSAVPVDHLAFTDSHDLKADRWYYDLDMNVVRRLHRQMIAREITPRMAYEEAIASWQKITEPDHLAAD